MTQSPASATQVCNLWRAEERGSKRVLTLLSPFGVQTRFMFRRMALREPVHVSVSYAGPTTPPATSPADGLSPWSARILEQLSLTAWLPAALLVANVFLVAGMYLVRTPAADPTMQNL